MIDVTFEIGGKNVDPNRIGDAQEKAMLAEVATSTKKALSSVTCPEHGQKPKVTIKGRTVDDLSWEIEGCCQALIDTAMEKLQ